VRRWWLRKGVSVVAEEGQAGARVPRWCQSHLTGLKRQEKIIIQQKSKRKRAPRTNQRRQPDKSGVLAVAAAQPA
jgi:hypothetical protein